MTTCPKCNGTGHTHGTVIGEPEMVDCSLCGGAKEVCKHREDKYWEHVFSESNAHKAEWNRHYGTEGRVDGYSQAAQNVMQFNPSVN